MMTEKAREARNRYMRQYREKNPDKIREIQERYWERKGEQNNEKGDGNERSEASE